MRHCNNKAAIPLHLLFFSSCPLQRFFDTADKGNLQSTTSFICASTRGWKAHKQSLLWTMSFIKKCLYGAMATWRKLYVPLFAGTSSGWCVYSTNRMGAMRESLRISNFLGPLLITIIATPTTWTVPTVTYQWMATMNQIAAEINVLQFCCWSVLGAMPDCGAMDWSMLWWLAAGSNPWL